MPAKRVVLVTPGQPALNPRLVKEADALTCAGFDVLVIYAYWNAWGTAFDMELLKTRKWKVKRVGGDPENSVLTFFLSRILYKISVTVTKILPDSIFKDWAIARGSFFLIREAKKHKADLYIGHNCGALPAIVKAAKRYGKPCGFDAEDFHRAELTDDRNDFDSMLKARIEEQYLPQVAYLSSSSPGISRAYRDLFVDKSPVTLLNVFPVEPRVKSAKAVDADIIKLFWFSQTISPARGVSDCVKSLKLIDRPGIELHLLGQIDENTRAQLLADAGHNVKVIFHEPISPDEVIFFANNFDIGLAMEESVPFNRDICLTNKIFTYMQAGLAIVASDTTGQAELIAGYSDAGEIYRKGDLNSFVKVINHYMDNPDDLFKAKESSFKIGREELNWENESTKFIELINDTLAD